MKLVVTKSEERNKPIFNLIRLDEEVEKLQSARRKLIRVPSRITSMKSMKSVINLSLRNTNSKPPVNMQNRKPFFVKEDVSSSSEESEDSVSKQNSVSSSNPGTKS